MKLTRREREAIIQAIDRWERVAAGLERMDDRTCALCDLHMSSNIMHCCGKCAVTRVFGPSPCLYSIPCYDLLPKNGNHFDARLTATAAAMLAAVLGVRVPRKVEQ